MSDPAKYRTKEELTDFKDNKDPIINLKKYMVNEAGMSDEELKPIDQEIKEWMKDVVEFAKETPEPPPEDLWTDVLKPVEETQ